MHEHTVHGNRSLTSVFSEFCHPSRTDVLCRAYAPANNAALKPSSELLASVGADGISMVEAWSFDPAPPPFEAGRSSG